MKKKITGIFALLLAAVIGINISGCAKRVQAADLSRGITPVKVEGKAADAKYSAAQMNFALKLLEKRLKKKEKKIWVQFKSMVKVFYYVRLHC